MDTKGFNIPDMACSDGKICCITWFQLLTTVCGTNTTSPDFRKMALPSLEEWLVH